MISLIELKNMEKYSSEHSLFTGLTYGILKQLQMDNPYYQIGVAVNSSSFISRKGNHCVSFDLYQNQNHILENQLVCGYEASSIVDGTILFFSKTDMDAPFIDIIQDVQL